MARHTDPTASLTPSQRQHLNAASAPIGSARDATADLDRLEDRTSQPLKAVGTLADV